MTPTRPP